MFNVKVHSGANGETGYAHHLRNLVRELNKTFPNSAVNKNVDVILDCVGSRRFYRMDELKGDIKIAYTVWETTKYPDDFLNQLLKFDQLWVPSEWQRENSIKQGYPADRVFVIPEGVDPEIFVANPPPHSFSFKDKICFLLIGKWEPRKSTTEIISSFVEEFKDDDDVILMVNVDNTHFPVDNFKSTEERLRSIDCWSPNKVFIVPFLDNREQYIELVKGSDVFVSCSRAEGWNLPLIEAMALGVPSIYSKCSGQLEFTTIDGYELGYPVTATKEIQPFSVYGYSDGNCPGSWYEPDFNELKKVMREIYDELKTKKGQEYIYNKAYLDSIKLVKNFSWSLAPKYVEKALDSYLKAATPIIDSDTSDTTDGTTVFKGTPISMIDDNSEIVPIKYVQESVDVIVGKSNINEEHVVDTSDAFSFNFNFWEGPYLEIIPKAGVKVPNTSWDVSFTDGRTGEVVYSTTLFPLGNSRALYQYNRHWIIKAVNRENREEFVHRFNPFNKVVLIDFRSRSLGDTIAWVPYCSQFQEMYDCDMSVSINKEYINLFQGVYPNIKFIPPGTNVNNVYARFLLGVFHENRQFLQPNDWRTVPLQKIASDILGLEFVERIPKLDISNAFTSSVKRPYRYVCISEHSTAVCKYWHNKNGWQDVVDHLNNKGIKVVVVSKESTSLKNVVNCTGNADINTTIGLLANCEAYVGLASGLAWLAWSIGKRVVMVSGFSEPWVEFSNRNYRVTGVGSCTGCLNDITLKDRAWDERCINQMDYSCTKNITSEMVISKLDNILDEVIPESLNSGNAMSSIKDIALKYCHGNGIDFGGGRWGLPGAVVVDAGDRLPEENGTLDYIFSSHCLEHISDWESMLSILIRKIKVGGILFLYLPHESVINWRPGGSWVVDHQWIPTFSRIIPVLNRLGMIIEDYNPWRDDYYSFHVIGRKVK